MSVVEKAREELEAKFRKQFDEDQRERAEFGVDVSTPDTYTWVFVIDDISYEWIYVFKKGIIVSSTRYVS